MERLSSGAEQLLKDIFEHRLANGSCDLEYWAKRFEVLESSFSNEVLIRSQFGTLRELGMISVRWASNVPYELHILDNGYAYYEQYLQIGFRKEQIQMYDVKVFVSYNHKTGADFADALEKKLEGKAIVLRDINHISSWGSITDFMKSIRDQDFAVAVITDAYLTSQACMYEIATMMRECDWQRRIIPAVLETDIYDNKAKYIQYWAKKKQELECQLKHAENISEEIKIHWQDVDQLDKINAEISDFIGFILDRKNPSVYTILDEIEKRVLSSSIPLISIPTELREKTEICHIRQTISKETENLLISAGNAQKRILFIQNLSGCSLGLEGEEGERALNDRMVAQWEESIKQLKLWGLIEQADIGGQIYKLTAKGYRMAEKINIERLLE